LFQVENILHLEYKDRLVNANIVTSEIHAKLRNSLYGHSVDFLCVKPGGTQNNQWAVSGKGLNNFYRSLAIIRVNVICNEIGRLYNTLREISKYQILIH